MTHHLSPYLAFDGTAREALQFYADVFGGEPRVTTFGALQVPGMPAQGVMHGELTTPAGWTVMASDSGMASDSAGPGGQLVRGGTTLCIWGDELDVMERQFARLAEGGQVTTPLQRQMWGDTYGDLTDRFGITWGFNVQGPGQADD